MSLAETLRIPLTSMLKVTSICGMPRRGGDTLEIEGAEQAVVAGEFSFALEDVDGDRALIVRSRREDFRLAGGNRGVARDEDGHHAAEGFHAE